MLDFNKSALLRQAGDLEDKVLVFLWVVLQCTKWLIVGPGLMLGLS